MCNKSFLTLLFFLFAAVINTTKSQPQQNTGKLNALAFIEGHWKAITKDRFIEAEWMPENGDNMLGFMRMMSGSKTTMYELLAYEQGEQGLVSRVKHFKPGMIGQEEKDNSDKYNFVEATKDKVVFQKEGEDLRIIYERRNSNQFAIMRGNLVEGKWAFIDLFVFNKVK